MSKLLKLKHCGDCTHSMTPQNRGYTECLMLDKRVNPVDIHPDCPLPDYPDDPDLVREMVEFIENCYPWFKVGKVSAEVAEQSLAILTKLGENHAPDNHKT